MDGEFLLNPVIFSGLAWKPRTPYKASCLVPHRRHRGFPHKNGKSCGCGIYGLKSKSSLKANKYWNFEVTGTIAGWGRVTEHEMGYRFEYAYPLSLDSIDVTSCKTWAQHPENAEGKKLVQHTAYSGIVAQCPYCSSEMRNISYVEHVTLLTDYSPERVLAELRETYLG